MLQLQKDCKEQKLQICKCTMQMLCSSTAMVGFVQRAKALTSVADGELLAEVIGVHSEKLARVLQEQGEQAAKAATRRMLKPLRERVAKQPMVAALKVPTAQAGPRTFHAWLAKEPAQERLRDIHRGKRILAGLRRWPTGWLKRAAVVCFERAAGRVKQERGGKPNAAFMKGVLKRAELPTAVAQAADHYVVVAPGETPRFMTVEEVARGFGVPAAGSLMAMLSGPTLTTVQAVSCLGRAVHVGVARQVVAMLLARGTIGPGLRYGSAYSGIDTFAAAVEAELGDQWTYAFASESGKVPRAGLLAAWEQRGLTAAACFSDACGSEAASAAATDLWVCTAECRAHSQRNHGKSGAKQRATLEDLWRSLEYVRRRRPAVVVLENVNQASIVGPLTAMLGRLDGYGLEAGVLDPRTTARAPMARERHFWVLTRA